MMQLLKVQLVITTLDIKRPVFNYCVFYEVLIIYLHKEISNHSCDINAVVFKFET